MNSVSASPLNIHLPAAESLRFQGSPYDYLHHHVKAPGCLPVPGPPTMPAWRRIELVGEPSPVELAGEPSNGTKQRFLLACCYVQIRCLPRICHLDQIERVLIPPLLAAVRPKDLPQSNALLQPPPREATLRRVNCRAERSGKRKQLGPPQCVLHGRKPTHRHAHNSPRGTVRFGWKTAFHVRAKVVQQEVSVFVLRRTSRIHPVGERPIGHDEDHPLRGKGTGVRVVRPATVVLPRSVEQVNDWQPFPRLNPGRKVHPVRHIPAQGGRVESHILQGDAGKLTGTLLGLTHMAVATGKCNCTKRVNGKIPTQFHGKCDCTPAFRAPDFIPLLETRFHDPGAY